MKSKITPHVLAFNRAKCNRLNMKKLILNIYRLIFLHPAMIRFNLGVYFLVLRGIGVLNYEDKNVSGEKFLLRQVAKKNRRSIIFDVGANVGVYSQFVKEAMPEAVLYSFEPHPLTYKRLQKVAEKYKFTAINAALDSITGSSMLFDYATADGTSHASLHNSVITEFHDSQASSVPIKTLSLDDFMIDHKIDKIDLLKIDTEGNEYPVLLGAANAIKDHRIGMIQFEFSELNIASRNFMKDFYDLLQGYEFYRLVPGKLYHLGKYNASKYEIFQFQNIVAISERYSRA